VWPLESIVRFTDGNGIVCLFDKVRNKVRQAKPDDDIFCAKRVWDRRAEFGYMKAIEDAFQELASEIITGTITAIDDGQKEKIDAFFALWKMRADYKTADGGAISFNDVTGAKWTPDQEEQFEKGHVSFFREGGTMPARMFYGLQIQFRIDAYARPLLRSMGNHSCAGRAFRRTRLSRLHHHSPYADALPMFRGADRNHNQAEYC
jgi:hypothetical protein